MECAIGWLIDGMKGEKRDFGSYMIPEDDIPEDDVAEVARLVKWVLVPPMMHPCDLISRSWGPVEQRAAEIQQRWLAWRPPCSSLWARCNRRGGDTARLSPCQKPHSNPIRQPAVPEPAPGAAKSHFPVFPSVSAVCHWREVCSACGESDRRRPCSVTCMQHAQG